ncbi:MAG TPA: hypothetical protein VFV67_10490 [Actinophytocola sp.]|uniref:hypothetical protein n=1 Tax=Actinophytocola sp. TaxID=1872138 RepID=UPI002DBE07E4|nr:hypothetical protein [Actinophytocola sp.]HEU5471071.1 hypothetical protein [Actinophytocola sp.]
MKRQAIVALTASALVTVSMVVAAPTSSADLVTHCVGTGGAVTVPGDLLVPAGESCTLDGTTVTGNVRVSAGSNLIVSGGTFQRDVQVALDGYLDVTDTTVTGQIMVAAGGFGAFLRGSETGGITLAPQGGTTVQGFLFVDDTTINGNVTSGVGEFSLTGAQITGNLSTDGAYYTDLVDSFLDGTLSVRNNATGSVVCGSAVQGAATFGTNQGGIQLGPNGNLDSCGSGGFFGRDVTISGTTGRTVVDDNIINGRLVLEANDPVAEVAGNNRIRGGIVGDHDEPGTARPAGTGRDRATDRAGERRAGAVQAAADAGRARL